MAKDFASLDVVVTGGAGALGTAVVGALLERGARCHVPCCDARELERFPYGSHPRVRVVQGVDLSEESAVTAFYEPLPALWASVHAAGGFATSPLESTTLADFRRMMDMNATTCFLCCREAVRRIRTSGRAGGRIVNVGARPSLVPTAGMAAYATSKAAVTAMTTALAEELAGEGVWVNAVVPSIMDTPANRAAMPGADHGLWPSVEDVAETIVFLASPANRSTRGALVPVYGRA